jgi:hypothetical protein
MERQDTDIGQDAQFPQHVHQFHVPRDHRFRLAVHQMVQDAVPGRRGWTIDRDEDPPPAHLLQLLDKWHDLPREIGDVVHQCDRPHWGSTGEPIARDEAGVGDPYLGGVRSKARTHSAGGFHVDDLATAQGQRERDPACPSADIDDNIFRGNIRGDDLQVQVERSTRIGLQDGVVSRKAREEVARGLWAAQAGPLCEDGIHPRRILVSNGSGLWYRQSMVLLSDQ